MFRWLDNLLNRITMYRLVMYTVFIYWLLGFVFSIFGLMPYEPFGMVISAIIITGACWLTNLIFAWAFDVPTNTESFYITAFILMVILTPIKASDTYWYWAFLAVASMAAIASKFILTLWKKHVFNPAALGAAGAALAGTYAASWWLGTQIMLPFVLIGGFLIVRKIQRSDMVWSFIFAAFASVGFAAYFRGFDAVTALERAFLHSPIFFFATVMITEPLTTPPNRSMRILYGLLVGAIFAPAVHLGDNYSTPELALLVGNVFSYLVSPKFRLMLTLKEKNETGPDLYDFVFTSDQRITFKPGQYLEWTLAHGHPDQRGNRRYFTIASSPTEDTLRLGVKFYPNSSSFKKTLLDMRPGDQIAASQLAGEFVLPEDRSKKLVFIAGGIGVTPFRSIVKHMIDAHEQRDAVMYYSAKTSGELVYKDIFEEGKAEGLKPIYVATDTDGYITAERIMSEVPDHAQRTYYISGPRSMVVMFEDALKKLGIPKSQIKTDFFPGFV